MKELFPNPLIAKHTGATSAQKHREKISTRPKKIALFLLYFAFTLLAINVVMVILVEEYGSQHPILQKIWLKFDLNTEFNIPTLFSFSLYLFASVLLYFISRLSSEKKKRNKWFWKSLSALFIFLCLDEALEIHEKFYYLKQYFNIKPADGSMQAPWIIAYFIVALAIGGIFLKLLMSVPRKTRNLFIVSGVSLCIAAMGFELPESFVLHHYGDNAAYIALYCTEQVMEMCSVILFIYSLLDYLFVYNNVRLTFEPPNLKNNIQLKS